MKPWIPLLASAALLAACGAKDETPASDTSAMAAATPATPAVTLESSAGDYDWVMKAETGDSVVSKGMSHQNADGSAWSVNAANPKDTTKYTAVVQGDSVISTSMPYTDPAMPKAVGQVTFRVATIMTDGKQFRGTAAISPVSKPDTVIARGKLEGTKR
jgi:hypothetical protein